MNTNVREAAVAGQFYPGSPAELNRFLDGALDSASADDAVRALIVPHAGYVYSGATAGKGFSKVRPGNFQRALIIAPTHRHAFSGLSVAPFTAYRTPLGELEVDRAACERLQQHPLVVSIAAAHRHEHSLEVELPFIQRLAPNAGIIPLVCGQLSGPEMRELAEALVQEWDNDTLVVISSDFTHYGGHFGYFPFPVNAAAGKLKELDGGAIDRILAKDAAGFADYVEKTGATICGRQPIGILLEMIGQVEELELELLDYTTSGSMSGDFSSSVSYAAIAVKEKTHG